MRQQIASAITIVIQLTRQSDGTRKLIKMCEITGMEQDLITMQDVFSFQRKGVGRDGKILGTFEPSRIRPKFVEQIRTAGIALPSGIFERAMEVA